ncbi:MAG: hypothetical protein K6G91_06370 [Kiritimatiellae bacterium]|nr:hypothetical protein [Kiritimatiellia bacterium]
MTIPDGHGGILETIYVDVPAMQNEETGEVFLGDDALGMLDHVKAVRMGGCLVEMTIQPFAVATSGNHPSKGSSSREMAYA